MQVIKMNKMKLSSDRQYIKNKICKYVDLFFDDLSSLNDKVLEQHNIIKNIEFEKTKLARAYAIKLGIVITRKKFKKLIANQRIDD